LFAPPPDKFTNKYLRILFNPILEMIDQPNPIRQQILFHLYDKGGTLTVGDLFNLINAQRNDIEKELLALQSEGLIEIERPSTRYGRIAKLRDDVDIFKEFYKASPSDIGKKMIQEIVMNYFKLGMYVAPVKQTPGKPRPDIIVIPYIEGTLKLDFNRAIAIEIEAYPESHKDQVIINITKDTVDLFNEVHVWTLESKKRSWIRL